MALGDTHQAEAPEEFAPSDNASQDSSEFLYLRDLLSALDMTSLSLSLVVRLLEKNELSPEIKKALMFVQETEQVRVLSQDILNKIETVSAAVEGTLQAVSVLDLSSRAAELLKSK